MRWVILLFVVGGCATPIEIPGSVDAFGGNLNNANAASVDARDRQGEPDAAYEVDSVVPIEPSPGDMGPDQSTTDQSTDLSTNVGMAVVDGASDASDDATGDGPDGLLDSVADSSPDLSGDLSTD